MGKKGSPASRSKENKSPKAPVITKSTPNLFSILFCEKCINDDFASASYPDPDQEQRFLSLAEATEAVAFLKEEKRELASCDEKISRLHQAMDQYESEKLSHEGRFPSGTKTNGASTRILSRSIRCQRCNNEVTTFSYSGPIQIQAVYDEKILLTVRLLAQVEAQRVALQIRTHTRRPAISRSQRRGLPIVLWKAIFSEVIRNSDGTDDSLILGAGSSSASLILSHVCSDWRAMAHLHPVLWRTISVWLSMLKKDYTMLLGTFLRYSKEMPLRVRMFDARWPGHRSSWPRVGDNGNRAFTLLMTQASRIEALELMLFDWNILTQWKQKSISFPILREFSALNQWDVVYQDTLSWFWDPVMQRIWGKHEWVTDRTKADVIRMTPQHETVVVAKAMEFRQLLQLLQGSRVTSLTVEDLTKG
uniref:F-box domain-containing protein n=1 Tax=Moniliophthora roreri TaxID=221103 RepID=A0A0W0FLS0_MONRR